jgi:hypothetical protein
MKEKLVYISEHGVYHLAIKCKLPIGEKFRDWLAEQVIPSIHRTGHYKLKESFNLQLAIKDEQLVSGIIKYHEDPIEYKYIYNLNQLMQPLMFIHSEEKAGNNNFHNEKMGIIKFFTEQLEQNVDNPKGTEYIIRFINCLPKRLFKTGSGVFNTLLNKLGNVMPELHLPGYSFCGP